MWPTYMTPHSSEELACSEKKYIQRKQFVIGPVWTNHTLNTPHTYTSNDHLECWTVTTDID